jgi:hypothetical protein
VCDCIDLQDRFGNRYRVTHDPASTPRGATDDPWYQRIPTRCGEIFPYDDLYLVVEVEGHRKLKAQLSRLNCCEIHQTGDDFGSFKFHVSDLDRIAAIVKPHRRQQLSEEERKRRADICRGFNEKKRDCSSPTHSEATA